MNNKVLLIIGASGLTGGEALNYAIKSNYYAKIYCLVRKSLAINSSLVEEILVDFDNLKALKLEHTFDDVVISLGTTIDKAGSKEAFEKVDYTAITESAQWAFEHGVRQCALVSSVGADASASNFYLKVKGKAEEKLKEIGFSRLAIFRPGLLLGDRKEHRVGESYAQRFFGLWTQSIGLLGKYTSVTAVQLAKSMVESLQSEEKGIHTLHYNDMKKYF
jgi:uncharacterized protein YbjT (DUF2867 family)